MIIYLIILLFFSYSPRETLEGVRSDFQRQDRRNCDLQFPVWRKQDHQGRR